MKFKIKEKSVSLLAFIIIVVILYGISWLATCGMIKLITLCFGITFKWSTATGIWLILCLVRPMIVNTK